jgi:hypothetical protein
MSAAQKLAAELRPYDCKIQSISDLTDGRAFVTLIRRDNTSVGIALSAADLEYWAARIAAILAKANEP